MMSLLALSLVVCFSTIAFNAKITVADCSTSCSSADNTTRTCPAGNVCVIDHVLLLKNDLSGKNFTVNSSIEKRCSTEIDATTSFDQIHTYEQLLLLPSENETYLFHTHQSTNCVGNKTSLRKNFSFIAEMEEKGWKFHDPLVRRGSFVDCLPGSHQCEHFSLNSSANFSLVCQANPCLEPKNQKEYDRALGSFVSIFEKLGLAVPPNELTDTATQGPVSTRAATAITKEATWSNQDGQATSLWKGITISVQAEVADAEPEDYLYEEDGYEEDEDAEDFDAESEDQDNEYLDLDEDADTKSGVTSGTTDTSLAAPLPDSPSKRFAWEWVVVGFCLLIVLKIILVLLCLRCIRESKKPKQKDTEKPAPEPVPVQPAQNSSEFDTVIGEPGMIDQSAFLDAEERDLCTQTDENSSENSESSSSGLDEVYIDEVSRKLHQEKPASQEKDANIP